MITINYLSHNREGLAIYWEIAANFFNKIKPENKQKIHINVLATGADLNWPSYLQDISCTVYLFPQSDLNYMEKVYTAIQTSGEYAVKLDEDCFIPNHVWDYMIENITVLDDDSNLILTPLLSNNIPNTDKFVETFLDSAESQQIYDCYLNHRMPDWLWGVNYDSLNKHTINADTWLPKEYYNSVRQINHYYKGIHPIRVCAQAHLILNQLITKHFSRLCDKHDYSIEVMDEPYYTTSAFCIKTQEWRNLLQCQAVDAFDEVQLNDYRNITGKKMLRVNNGFSIHTLYNTLYGSIDGGRAYELDFVSKLRELLQ